MSIAVILDILYLEAVAHGCIISSDSVVMDQTSIDLSLFQSKGCRFICDLYILTQGYHSITTPLSSRKAQKTVIEYNH